MIDLFLNLETAKMYFLAIIFGVAFYCGMKIIKIVIFGGH